MESDPAPSADHSPAPPPPPAADPLEAAGHAYQQRITAARQAGATWDQVYKAQAAKYQQLQAAGASEDQIRRGMGLPADSAVMARIKQQAAAHVAAGASPTDVLGAVGKWGDNLIHTFASDVNTEANEGVAGMKTGLADATMASNPFLADANRYAGLFEFAGGAGQWATAWPAAAVDTMTGAAMEHVGLPRTTVSQFLQLVLPFGSHGIGEVPHAVNSDYLASGRDADSFIQAHTDAGHAPPTTEQAAALRDHFPSPQERVDAGITVAGPGASPTLATAAQRALEQHWLDTGEKPGAAAERATADPVLRQSIMTGALSHPDVPAGSARSNLLAGGSQFVLPKMVEPVIHEPGIAAATADRSLSPDAGAAVDDWLSGRATAELDGAYAPNPTPAGAALRAQLRAAAEPIRDALGRTYGKVLTLYRPAGPTGHVASFTNSLSAATALVGGDATKLVTEHVPVGDVAWAARGGSALEVVVHVGEDGKSWSLSKNAPPSDTLAHGDSGPVPKQVTKAAPLELARDPRVVLNEVRAGPRDWISNALGMDVQIFSGFRPGAHVAGTNRLSEHASNAAWDFGPHGVSRGVSMEHAGITLARNLREKGVPFDQVEITPTHVHIGFKADGVGNRSEIIYHDMKPGAEAHGVALSGDTRALTEGSIKPTESGPPAAPVRGGLLSQVMADDSGGSNFGGGNRPPSGPPEGGNHWDEIASHVAEPDYGPGGWERFTGLRDDAYRQILNPSHPTQLLTRAAQEGGKLPELDNPEDLQRLAEYAPDKANVAIEDSMINLDGDKIGPGLKAIIGKYLSERGTKNFFTYMIADWSRDALLLGRDTPIRAEAADAALKEGAGKYAADAARLVNFQNQTLAWLRDSGLIKEASYDKWVEDNKARIPGYRVQEGGKTGAGSAGKGITGHNPIKSAHGSELDIQNVLQSILRDTYLRRQLAENNIAARATVDAAAELGLMTRVKADKLVKMTLSPGDIGEAAWLRLMAERTNEDKPMDVTLARMIGSDLKNNEVPVYRDGEFEKWAPASGLSKENAKRAADMVKQLRGFDKNQLAAWQKLAAPMAKFTRAGYVLNPLFAPKIALLYDPTFQGMTNPEVGNIFKAVGNLYAGIGHVFGNTELYHEAMRKGNLDHVFAGLGQNAHIKNVLRLREDPSFLQGVWNLAKTPYEMLRAWGLKVQHVNPVGRYANATPAERANRAHLAYTMSEVPFHRAGSGGSVGKAINSTTPFFLAWARSLETVARAAIGHNKPGLTPMSLKQFYGGGALVTTAALTNYAVNRDKEWYKALPDWQKDATLPVHIGPDWEITKDGDGNDVATPRGITIRLPLPPLISTLFSAIPRRLAAAFIAHDPRASKGLAASLLATLAPPGSAVAASVFTPFLEQAMGKSFFTGRPLVSDEVAKREKWEQYTPYTSGVARVVGGVLGHAPVFNPSPAEVDQYIKDWSGTLGEAAVRTVDLAAAHTGLPGYDKTPAPDVADWPLIGSFVERTGANMQGIRSYMDLEREEQGRHDTMLQAIKDDDFAKFSKLVDADPVSAVTGREDISGVAQPANPGQYADKLDAAAAKLDQAKLDAYYEADRAVHNQMKVVKFVWSLPVRANAAPVTVAAAQNEEATAITPNDKRQLLDTVYGTLTHMSDTAVRRAADVGLK